MKLEKASKRDRKINRRRHGHREDGRSNKLIWEIKNKKATEVRDERKGG